MNTSTTEKGSNERGFTLPELMIVIVLLGILAAIAMPVWWSIVESRNVEAATNQVVADMRLAHSRASNRLTDSVFTITSDNTYQITGGGDTISRTLEGAKLSSTTSTIRFCSRGTVQANCLTGSPGNAGVTVMSEDDGSPRIIQVNGQTASVKIGT